LPNDYDKLTEAQKENYRNFSDDTDSFNAKVLDESTLVYFQEDDKENRESKARIVFGLDKESENLQNFYTNSTLDYISDETTDGIMDNIANRGKTKAYNILRPFLSKIESFKPL